LVGPPEGEGLRWLDLHDRQRDLLAAGFGVTEDDLTRRAGTYLVSRSIGPPLDHVFGVADDIEDDLWRRVDVQLTFDGSKLDVVVIFHRSIPSQPTVAYNSNIHPSHTQPIVAGQSAWPWTIARHPGANVRAAAAFRPTATSTSITWACSSTARYKLALPCPIRRAVRTSVPVADDARRSKPRMARRCFAVRREPARPSYPTVPLTGPAHRRPPTSQSTQAG
jgi:hypothetical protein